MERTISALIKLLKICRVVLDLPNNNFTDETLINSNQ